MTYAQRIKHRKPKPGILSPGWLHVHHSLKYSPPLSVGNIIVCVFQIRYSSPFTCIPATALSCNLLWLTKLSRATLTPRWRIFLKLSLIWCHRTTFAGFPWDPALQTWSLDKNNSSTLLPRTSSKYADGTEFLFLGPLFASIVCKDLRSAY